MYDNLVLVFHKLWGVEGGFLIVIFKKSHPDNVLGRLFYILIADLPKYYCTFVTIANEEVGGIVTISFHGRRELLDLYFLTPWGNIEKIYSIFGNTSLVVKMSK